MAALKIRHPSHVGIPSGKFCNIAMELDISVLSQTYRGEGSVSSLNSLKEQASHIFGNQIQHEWDKCWKRFVGRTRQNKQDKASQERMFLVVVQCKSSSVQWHSPAVSTTKFLQGWFLWCAIAIAFPFSGLSCWCRLYPKWCLHHIHCSVAPSSPSAFVTVEVQWNAVL